ncbi:uncharacterized protein LOC126265568 [Aethina tumida]|uniref:uncharacterized protein LOC126265568 n=1 Tax=Aethina tumida TaxID=116153 RepID=UPI00214760D9|nr:uncharacterized protein LOC126265568 [Aethina tumida]
MDGLDRSSEKNCCQNSDSPLMNNNGIDSIQLRGDPKAAKLGDRYETSILTHFAIRCALDKTIRNFQIVYNAKDHGDLDDIVINEDNHFITCVQLKHKAERSNISLEYKKYEKTYNDVLVPKYQNHFQKGFNRNLNNEGMKKVAEILISSFNDSSGNGIDKGDDNGNTPLMIATQWARNDSTYLIKFFIEQGADINRKDKMGQNIWYYLRLNMYLNEDNIKSVENILKSKQ